MPIARLIITEAAIRIGKAFARVAAVMAGTFPLSRQPARIEPRVKGCLPEVSIIWLVAARTARLERASGRFRSP